MPTDRRYALLAGGCIAASAILGALDDAGARPVYGASSTAYCLRGLMADGTRTRPGSAASNRHPLGTRLQLVGAHGPSGRRRYVVRDRIGSGSDLDLWTGSCQRAIVYGRRSVRYRLGWTFTAHWRPQR